MKIIDLTSEKEVISLTDCSLITVHRPGMNQYEDSLSQYVSMSITSQHLIN